MTAFEVTLEKARPLAFRVLFLLWENADWTDLQWDSSYWSDSLCALHLVDLSDRAKLFQGFYVAQADRS